MKQVVTTSDFATLDENTKNCEDGANYVDCVSQKYMKAVIEQCNCLPYRLQNYSAAMEVQAWEGFLKNKSIIYYYIENNSFK